MRRREFFGVLGSAITWPVTARAQQGRVHRIGFLANDPTIPRQPAGQAFLDGLRESGFVEGKNISIERRFAEARPDRYPELVDELMRLGIDVLITSAEDATLAAKRATLKIPIVMLNVSDPVGQGIVPSLSHPGGNITGVIQDDSPEVASKRLQFLKDAIPRAAEIAVLTDPTLPYRQAELQQLELAAHSLSLTLRQYVLRRRTELEGTFAAIERDRPAALFLTASSQNFVQRKLILEFASKNQLPTMAVFREYPEAGGLMSYGNTRTDRFRRAAIYVGKILNGAKPADLPVEQPTKYELVINLKAAKSLDLEIPRNLLDVADEVIE